MGRPLRAVVGGIVYHVLNRGNDRRRIFDDAGDYAAFEKVLAEAVERFHTRLLAYCLMPNHWHLVLWPHHDAELSRFTSWLSVTHTQRRHAHRQTAGAGHLYQGRFKSFPIQTDAHFLIACRYVERNALRAALVDRAEHWRWGSLWRRERGTEPERQVLAEWPMPRPADWLEWVNAPATAAEEQALQLSLTRGSPFGEAAWQRETAAQLGLGSTLRPRGRPGKPKPPEREPEGGQGGEAATFHQAHPYGSRTYGS